MKYNTADTTVVSDAMLIISPVLREAEGLHLENKVTTFILNIIDHKSSSPPLLRGERTLASSNTGVM